jgi:hypothetical protein
MELFIAASTEMARGVVDRGFVGSVGRPTILYETDEKGDFLLNPNGSRIESSRADVCEFRDIPPRGLTPSRTTEVTSEVDEDRIEVTMDGGPVLADDLGDFILSIQVPDDFALVREAHEDPPSGWPFREFWLTSEEADLYRDTLKVYDSSDGEEIRPDLVGK